VLLTEWAGKKAAKGSMGKKRKMLGKNENASEFSLMLLATTNNNSNNN